MRPVEMQMICVKYKMEYERYSKHKSFHDSYAKVELSFYLENSALPFQD